MNIFKRLYSTKSHFTPSIPVREGRGVGLFSLIFVGILTLTSCGPNGNHCDLDGRFLKMNQGEFRIYSPDGTMTNIDTITVQGGRFEYSAECNSEGIAVIVLPNFTELPVFVKPGKTIELRADATHIKDIEITGTDANEEMTKWRKQFNDLSPVQQANEAEKFIQQNPKSIVSRWLLYKYLASQPNPDYKKVAKLAKLMREQLADEISSGDLTAGQTSWLTRLEQGALAQQSTQVGARLPSFNATDIYGKKISSAGFMTGYAVITLFSSYNYDSQNINRMLKNLTHGPSMPNNFAPGVPPPPAATTKHVNAKVLSISIDPSKVSVRQMMHNDSLPWQVVCDEKMWDSPLIKKLGLARLPDNILLKDGKVIGRHMKWEDIQKKMQP